MSNDDDFEDIEEGEEEEFEEEEEDTTIANPDVVQKYKFASNFANKALQTVLAKVAPGVTVLDLCSAGDQVILDEVAKVYNKGVVNPTTGEPEKVEKGIAFPTSVSVNNIVCHFSPGEEENKEIPPLVAGDVIRIDLGCHVDGYCAVVAETVVVGGIAANPKAADVITAAHTALDIAIKALRPDTKAYEVTEIIDKVAKDFGVNAVEGVLSHRLNRYIIDGVSCIANKDFPEGKVRDITLGSNEVWGLDVVMSTGPGKLRQRDLRTMIFKRSLESNYQLKLQASRDVFNEVNSKFQTFPFSIRHLDQKRARIGITECLKHDVVVPYPVLYEKDGEIVAHVKATVLVLGTKIEPVTGLPLDATVAAAATKTVQDPKVLQWKGKSLALKKKNKGKKKAAKAAATEPAADAAKK
eukprot:PhF_6_TR33826/c0_g1_i1/m.49608